MKLAHSASKRFVERAKAKAEETGDSARRRLDFDNVAEKKNGKTGEGKVDGKGEGKGAKKDKLPKLPILGLILSFKIGHLGMVPNLWGRMCGL